MLGKEPNQQVARWPRSPFGAHMDSMCTKQWRRENAPTHGHVHSLLPLTQSSAYTLSRTRSSRGRSCTCASCNTALQHLQLSQCCSGGRPSRPNCTARAFCGGSRRVAGGSCCIRHSRSLGSVRIRHPGLCPRTRRSGGVRCSDIATCPRSGIGLLHHHRRNQSRRNPLQKKTWRLTASKGRPQRKCLHRAPNRVLSDASTNTTL